MFYIKGLDKRQPKIVSFQIIWRLFLHSIWRSTATTIGSREPCSDKVLIGIHRIAQLFPVRRLRQSLIKVDCFEFFRLKLSRSTNLASTSASRLKPGKSPFAN